MANYLVVGASGIIGGAVARGLAAPGVSIGLHYCTNLAAVVDLKVDCPRAGARVELLQSALDCEEACAGLVERAGAPDGVALCAGRVPWREWQDLAEPDWRAAMFEHCIAPFAIVKAAVLKMVARGSGRIAFLSSIAPKYGGSPRTLHYAAAKGAREVAMRGLARDVAGRGVRINGVRAGFVQSPQQRVGRTPAEISERIAKIPVGRGGKPEEIAVAMAFLLFEAADFMTGELITVAGGD